MDDWLKPIEYDVVMKATPGKNWIPLTCTCMFEIARCIVAWPAHKSITVRNWPLSSLLMGHQNFCFIHQWIKNCQKRNMHLINNQSENIWTMFFIMILIRCIVLTCKNCHLRKVENLRILCGLSHNCKCTYKTQFYMYLTYLYILCIQYYVFSHLSMRETTGQVDVE